MQAAHQNSLPLVTVLLPVYNLAAYVGEAIESILRQDFRDFEFIIINDGSTDDSEKVILSFNDERIKYIRNENNLGLIATLNKGIALARGKFIARMDADDISLPSRFKIQLEYFEKCPEAAVVCSPVLGITPLGNPRDGWDVDLKTRTPAQINRTLAKENCLAHPTVMIRTGIAKEYLYRKKQKGSEDWDLWMRMAADGKVFVKTKEFLLKYRFHPQGVTTIDNTEKPVEKKVIKVKRVFLWGQFLKFKWNSFWFRAFYSFLRSIARHWKLNVLPRFVRNCKRILTISPFTAKKQFVLFKAACKKMNDVDIFFFFPYCHIGGAEKVHANIVEAFSDKKIIVFFTTISHKDDFLYMFQKFAPSLNIGFCLNYPLYAKRTRQIIFDLVEKQKETIVFGCNNVFFYNAVLKFRKNVRVFDLAHDFRLNEKSDLSHTWTAQYFRCEKRIFISQKAIEETKKFYTEKFADPPEFEKLTLIVNYTFVPVNFPAKDYDALLRILYVGRNTSEKRAALFAQLAKQCKEKTNDVQFAMVGELQNIVPADCKPFVNCMGAIYDFEQLKKVYEEYHLIVITSEREGFPLAIMEGMAHGLVPLSSPVGDVPVHVKDNAGFVTSSIEAGTMLKEMESVIEKLNNDRALLKKMSGNSYNYAKSNFSKDKFTESYRNTLKI